MLEDMLQRIDELEGKERKKSKSVMITTRCPLPLYKLIYYYMKLTGTTNKSEAINDLIQYGFSYFTDKLGD